MQIKYFNGKINTDYLNRGEITTSIISKILGKNDSSNDFHLAHFMVTSIDVDTILWNCRVSMSQTGQFTDRSASCSQNLPNPSRSSNTRGCAASMIWRRKSMRAQSYSIST